MTMEAIVEEATRGARPGRPGAAFLQVAAALRPGWTVLQGCTFGGDATIPAIRVEFALLHPHVGVALLDLSRLTAEEAGAERLAAALAAAGFAELHGGIPPIVHLTLTNGSVHRLAAQLDAAFGKRPPIALRGGDAWVYAARSMLAPQLAGTTGSGRAAIGDAVGADALREWMSADERVKARRSARRRSVSLLSGVVALVAAGSGVLQYFGWPGDHGGVGAGSEVRPYAGALPPLRADDVRSPASHPAPAPLASSRVRADPAARGTSDEMHAAPRAAEPPPSLATLLRVLSEAEPPVPEDSFAVAPLPIPFGIAVEGAEDGEAEDLAGKVVLAQREGTLGEATEPLGPPSDATRGFQGEAAFEGEPRSEGAVSRHQSAGPTGTWPEDVPALVPPPPVAPPAGLDSAPAPPAVGSVDTGTSEDTGAPQVAALIVPSPLLSGVAPARPELSPAMIEILMRRGRAMMALGDISAARLLYERAAAAGEARAAAALGRTYDPAYLSAINARVQPDRAAAMVWYRRAAELGDHEAMVWFARQGER